MEYQDIVDAAETISTPLGLVSLIVLLASVAYYYRVKFKKEALKGLKSDKEKIRFVADWLNLPVEKLKGESLYLAVDSSIKSRLIVTISAMVLSFIFLILVISLIIFDPNDDIDTSECQINISDGDNAYARDYFPDSAKLYARAVDSCAGTIKRADAKYKLGRSHRQMENYDISILHLNDALNGFKEQNRSNNQLAKIYSNIGYSYEGSKNYEASLEALHLARKNNPTSTNAITASGRVYFKMAKEENFKHTSNIDRALEFFKASLEQGPGTKAFINYAVICLTGIKNGFDSNSLDDLFVIFKSRELTTDIRSDVRKKSLFQSIVKADENFLRATRMPSCPPLLRYINSIDKLDDVVAALE